MGSEMQVVDLSFVAPSTETPRKSLWVSSLDLSQANRGHTPTVYFYRSSTDAGDAYNLLDPSRLKESMAKALVAFYPLAGRVGVDCNGRMEINCNSEGALFVVARSSELAVDDFNDLEPSPELRRLFVPPIEPSSIILAVQVTLLKCGGAVLGIALHHVAIDAVSAFHFIQTWSAISRDGDGAAVELPCHDRTLLRARSPPTLHPDALSALCPKLSFSEPSGPVTTNVFVVSKDQLSALRRVCGGGGASTFCAVTALLWQCACAARRLRPDATARVIFPANIRRVGVMVRPPLPGRYFGNAIVPLCASGAARDIASEPLERVAARIGATVNRLDDELVRSAIDCLELRENDCHRPLRGGSTLPDTDLRVVSWLGMPLYDADFGWGRPWRMSRAESVRGGNVHLMKDGPAANSGIRILACLEAANIREFERLLYAKL